MRAPKVLIYNWAPYDQTPNHGSGVSTICRNLINGLLNCGVEVSFLYSGTDYSFWKRKPLVREIPNQHDARVRSFSLVNSPRMAPSVFTIHQPEGDESEPELEASFADFLARTGPYGAIHFQSLEGLSAGCLRIAKSSGARVVYSLNNYWTICPQVNLWQSGSHPCRNDRNGVACVTCSTSGAALARPVVMLKRWHSLFHRLRLAGQSSGSVINVMAFFLIRGRRFWPSLTRRLLRRFVERAVQLPPSQMEQRGLAYLQRRKNLLQTIAESVDEVVSGSQRTADIHRAMGLRNATHVLHYCVVDYPKPALNPAGRRPEDPFRIVFLGKIQTDKGFPFLVDELKNLPPEIASRVELRIAGRSLYRSDLTLRAHELKGTLRAVHLQEGFRQSELPDLLNGAHLTIVPSLWEDTLPQVALESLVCKVPVLTSNRGGAQEVIRHPSFLFAPQIAGDFREKFCAIVENPRLSETFWSNVVSPPTVAEYAETMLRLYRLEQKTKTA